MGKGGSPAPQPTSTSQTSIPEYAKPYVERMLGKAEAASQTPYQTYGGQRLTEATPEQQAARQSVAGMQAPGQFGMGTGLTAAGGLSALGAGQTYMGMATSPEAQQAFMSPYMQNVVNVQQREAIRAAQQGQLGANLAAARQGTYGGARQEIAKTERERNLQDQLARIQATGLQSAYEQAQKGIQFGTDVGLRGAGQAAQAGIGLGQLGTQQQAAGLDLARAQEQFGGLGQREKQAALDLAYQDFIRQQQYPYAQLGFMSDILRGSANLAQTGSRAIYEAPPSTGAQLLGLASTLGGAYLGGGGRFAEGGEVKGLSGIKGYAEGGEVSDVVKDMADVDKLTRDQIENLQQSKVRKDVPDFVLLAQLDKKTEEIERFKALMASQGLPAPTVAEDIRAKAMQEVSETTPAGIDAIPIPDDYYRSEDEVAQMAGGGIVAFANGGQSQLASDREAFLSGLTRTGSAAADIATLVPRGLIGAFNTGVIRPLRAITGSESIPYAKDIFAPEGSDLSSMTPFYDKYVRSKEPPVEKVKKEEPKPAAQPPKQETKPAAKTEVPDRTVKKIERAEDAYEKALRKELDKTNLSDDDKMQALGFALMKFGSKAMKGRKGREFEAYGEGIEAAADDYVKTLQTAKKDRRELTKTLAEYGLAKERIGVQREQVEATLASGLATREATLAGRLLGAQQAREKLIADILEQYDKSPMYSNPKLKDTYIPPEVFVQNRLRAITGISGGAPSGGTPTTSLSDPKYRQAG